MKCFRYILMCGYIEVTQMTCYQKKERKKEPVSYRLRSISAQVFVPLDHDVLFREYTAYKHQPYIVLLHVKYPPPPHYASGRALQKPSKRPVME